jgi:hypothetical protein
MARRRARSPLAARCARDPHRFVAVERYLVGRHIGNITQDN